MFSLIIYKIILSFIYFSTQSFALVEVCPKCEDEWIDEKGYEALYNLFTRKTFKIGGSLAIRIPKEIANVVGLKEGAGVKLAVMEKKIVIEPA